MYISYITLRCCRSLTNALINQHSKVILRYPVRPFNTTNLHNYKSRILWNVFYTWSVNAQLSRAFVFNTVVSQNVELSRSVCLKSNYHLQVKDSNASHGYFLWLLWIMWECCQSVFRIVQLACIFVPVILLYPLTLLNSSLRSIWYHILLFGIEFSGPIFMKLGQWASTRRDLFSEELCSHLAKLQRKIKPHSWYYTKKTLERAYGPQWQSILVKFDNERQPIGSGCCAQVYKAWIKPAVLTSAPLHDRCYDDSEHSFIVEGLELFGVGYILGALDKDGTQKHDIRSEGLVPVAVKVLHPRMKTLLSRDLRIMRAVAATVTWAVPSLRWLSLTDCLDDFAHVMQAQINFCEEAHNLEIFAQNFKTVDSVKFPYPVWSLTKPNLLVESFEEGQHVQHYVINSKVSTNKILAEVGINTILKMVFEDNFAHGDLHPGNMLVQEVHEQDTKGYSNSLFWLRPTPSPLLRLVILDCGIVSTLDERGRMCLKEVFSAVALGDGEKVAELFLNHSNHQCTNESSFKSSMSEIVHNALHKSVTLEQVEVSTLMTALFSTMIRHQVKVDGSFSSVIIAIMVLEGLGRSLDPSVDMVEKAKPFLFSSL